MITFLLTKSVPMEKTQLFVTVLTLIFFGMRYLHRDPLTFIILPAFLRGLLGARR
jgi:hypothetical protein